MVVVIAALNEGDWGHILYVWEPWWDFTMRLSLQRQVIHSWVHCEGVMVIEWRGGERGV